MNDFEIYERLDDLGGIIYDVLTSHSIEHKKFEEKYLLNHIQCNDYWKLNNRQLEEIYELNHKLPIFKELFLIFENGIDMKNSISDMNIEDKKIKLKEAYDIVYNELLKYDSLGIKELDEMYNLTINNL